jgi:anaerobic ribonucleoside-triphosphate reductase activating protein
VVFFQGCSRNCQGCFNPETHPFTDTILIRAPELLDGFQGVEGITVSGGEPFMQPEGLCSLLEAARRRGLSTVVYTGFTLDEISGDPARTSCLEHLDVLVDGPYDSKAREMTSLARGSTNQRFHFLTTRYELSDFCLPGRSEVLIGRDGTVRSTGFNRISFPTELI